VIEPTLTSVIGYLTWTHVVGSEVTLDAVEDLLDGVELPARPIPIDVFRRVTGTQSTSRHALDDLEVVLSAVKAKSPDTMVVRDLVMTVAKDGVTQSISRVGTAVFYKPPRNDHGKARMRVETHAVEQSFREVVANYVQGLRETYERGCAGHLDEQAVRRLVRRHLISHNALYLGGPYFTLEAEAVDALRPLFSRLSTDSVFHTVPMPDRPEDRELLARGVERALAKGQEVDERIWQRLEGQ
jgi:hypothetical protein